METAKIDYILHSYPCKEALDAVTVAGKIGAEIERVFKTLVTEGKRGNYYVFVVPGAEELDLKKAAQSVGEKSVSMIHVKDINKITGYIHHQTTITKTRFIRNNNLRNSPGYFLFKFIPFNSNRK